jgi:hypothetical protein
VGREQNVFTRRGEPLEPMPGTARRVNLAMGVGLVIGTGAPLLWQTTGNAWWGVAGLAALAVDGVVVTWLDARERG